MSDLISRLHEALRQRNWWHRRARRWERSGVLFNEYRAASCWLVGSTYDEEVQRQRALLKKQRQPPEEDFWERMRNYRKRKAK